MELAGKVQRRKEGRVEKKACAAHPQWAGLEPGTYRMLGEGPQLHTMGVVSTSKPFRAYR